MALDLSNNRPNLFPPKNGTLRPSPMNPKRPKFRFGVAPRCPFVPLHTSKGEPTILYLSIVNKFWRADGTHDKR
jgi:hypothetical protein